MLIVVAIIAILIAISIPMVNTALEKSRHAVDDANVRAAIGLGNIYYLTQFPKDRTADVVGWYEVDGTTHQGNLFIDAGATPSATLPAGATKAVTGKCTGSGVTGTDACDGAVDASSNKIGRTKKNIKVTIKATGEVSAIWYPTT